MIAILNYGLGNIQSFADIYKRLNIYSIIALRPEDLLKATKIILPGVGSFDWAMKRLNESGMRDVLDEMVLIKKTPVLGICVGMQMMARKSEEGCLEGLGWIEGDVIKFDHEKFSNKNPLPHMGWNDVKPRKKEGILKNLDSDARFYFLHSYHFVPDNPEHLLSDTDYQICFASSVNKNNIYGVQFHPEKSHNWGVQLLKNFSDI